MFSQPRYQRLASRTETDYVKAAERINQRSLLSARLLHGVIGLMGEVGELSSALEKAYYYGQELDVANILEEIGDCYWYLANLCNTLDVNIRDIETSNINKLRERFPEKFDQELVKEENRNREKEREIIEQEHKQSIYSQHTDPDHLPNRLTDTFKCPNCKGMLSGALIRRMWEDKCLGMCPNCLYEFSLKQKKSGVLYLKLKK